MHLAHYIPEDPKEEAQTSRGNINDLDSEDDESIEEAFEITIDTVEQRKKTQRTSFAADARGADRKVFTVHPPSKLSRTPQRSDSKRISKSELRITNEGKVPQRTSISRTKEGAKSSNRNSKTESRTIMEESKPSKRTSKSRPKEANISKRLSKSGDSRTPEQIGASKRPSQSDVIQLERVPSSKQQNQRRNSKYQVKRTDHDHIDGHQFVDSSQGTNSPDRDPSTSIRNIRQPKQQVNR